MSLPAAMAARKTDSQHDRDQFATFRQRETYFQNAVASTAAAADDVRSFPERYRLQSGGTGFASKENIDVIVKLGGAALTDKTKPHTFAAQDRFNGAIQSIAEAYKRGWRMIVCLGAGSFGHFEARKHGISEGHATACGMAETHSTVSGFSAFVVDLLNQAGVPAMAISPLSCEFCGVSATRCSFMALQHGMIPVIHGDVSYGYNTEILNTCKAPSAHENTTAEGCLNFVQSNSECTQVPDREQVLPRSLSPVFDAKGTCIYSADDIMVSIVTSGLFTGIKRAVFVTDVDGLYGTQQTLPVDEAKGSSICPQNKSRQSIADTNDQDCNGLLMDKPQAKQLSIRSESVSNRNAREPVDISQNASGLIRKVIVNRLGDPIVPVNVAQSPRSNIVDTTGGIRGKLHCAGKIAGFTEGRVTAHIVGVGSTAMYAALDPGSHLDDNAFAQCTTVVYDQRFKLP